VRIFPAERLSSPICQVTDYGDENPLLMDYYGFDRELYQLKFASRGDADLSQRVVEQFRKASMQCSIAQ
jgi:aromatic ring-opening dioxygenase catalytic subunit (LigB family)